MLRFSCEVRKQPGPEGGDEGGSEPVRRSVSLVFVPIPAGPGVGRRDPHHLCLRLHDILDSFLSNHPIFVNDQTYILFLKE